MPVNRPPMASRPAPEVAYSLAGRTVAPPPSSIGAPFSKEEWHSMTQAQRLWAMTQAQRIWRAEGSAHVEAQAPAEASGAAVEPPSQTVPSQVNRGDDLNPTTHAVSYSVSVTVTAEEFAAFVRFQEAENNRLFQSSSVVKEKTAQVPAKAEEVPERTRANPEKPASVPENNSAVPAKTVSVPKRATEVPDKTSAVPAKTAAVPEQTLAVPDKPAALPPSAIHSKHRDGVKLEDISPFNDSPAQPVHMNECTQTALVVPSNLLAPQSVEEEGYEKNPGKAFENWSYNSCPKYDGAGTVDVFEWISRLKLVLQTRMVCPSIWHKVGFRLLTGKAFHDCKNAIAEGCLPTSWDAFAFWLIQHNSVCVNKQSTSDEYHHKQSISDEYDRLRQGQNETCLAFYDRFCEWQILAKTHNFSYEPTTGFVGRLTPALSRKVSSKIYSGERRGSPMSFQEVVGWALDEDRMYRSRFAPSSNFISNKRLFSPGSATEEPNSGRRKHENGAYEVRPCYNCNKEGHVSINCPAPKTHRQLMYEAQGKRKGVNYVSRVASTSSNV